MLYLFPHGAVAYSRIYALGWNLACALVHAYKKGVIIVLSIYLKGSNGSEVSEVVIAPTKNCVKVFHRIDKQGEVWKLVEAVPTPDYLVNHEAVAVVMSELDKRNIEFNNVSNLAVKCKRAVKNNAGIEAVTMGEYVSTFVTRLLEGDITLNNFISDPRYKNPIKLEPIVATQAPQVTSPIVMQAQKQDSYSMAMATIPDNKWAKEYISRKVSGNLTEFQVYDVAMKNHENILLEGHAGSGKTISVLAYASLRGYRYYNVSSHIGLEPSQLFGKWIPTPDGNFKWQDGAVTDLVRHGGVLLLNEVNFMPERITTILFGLLDARREIQLMDNSGEVIKANNELLVVADMNPNYRGTRPMNQAWKDRFHHILEFPYDNAIENKIVKSKALITLANQLREEFEKEALETPISTRKLVAFVNNTKTLGLEYAVTCFVNSFAETERRAVKLVMETHLLNLKTDLVEPATETIKPITDTAEVVLN